MGETMGGRTVDESGSGATRGGIARPGLWVIFSPVAEVEGATVALTGAGLLLGRDTVLDGGRRLANPRISSRHAEITASPRGYLLSDLGSRNGTRLNGRRFEGAVELRAGDVIELGGTFLELVSDTLGCASLEDDDVVSRELIGPSQKLRQLRTCIRQLAPLSVNVLVTGPSGSGKERAATALHLASGRQGKLVSLNCAVLTSDLAASELFGHVKGAFTGAERERLGAFREAVGGTLFLDELGELPLPLQAKLLRALQEQRVRPVGGDGEVRVDVRVVAATNRNLTDAVNAERFRGDLFSRVAASVIEVPALAARPADVVALAHYFLDGRRLHREAVRHLLRHDWPYNVRDLRTIVALIAAGGSRDSPARLTAPARAKLGLDRQLRGRAAEAPALAAAPPPRGAPPPVGTGGEIIWPADPGPRTVLLEQLLIEHRGNLARIAERLGKSTRSVRRWIKQYGLDADRYR